MPAFRTPTEETVVPGQIIVKYEEATASSEQAALRRQENLEKKGDLGLINAEVVEVEERSTGAALRDLNARADVEYAEPNFRVYPTGFADEPSFSKLWGLHNTGQAIDGSTGTANVDVNGKEASARTQGSPTLKVAVIDDGVDFSHPDLSARRWVNPGETPNNGVDDDRNGYVDDVNGWDFCHQDNTVHDNGDDAHGTHVSGTIAASVNNTGVVGVAPNVKIMALKFLSENGTGAGCNSTAGAIEAIGYAKKMSIKISNNSYGGGAFSRALKDAIDASGQLFVAAAGNGGSDGVGDNNDASPFYPASYTSPNLLSVAAVNNRGSLGSFSNYGKTSVDISAPGVGILSSVPGNTGEPGAVLSSVGSSGKALTAGFGAEEIGTAAKQASFFGKAFQAIGRGSQQVVLVDDDGSHDGEFANVGPTVAAAIQSATGSAPQTIQVGEGDGPSLSELSGKTVVWSTGESFYSGFDSEINFIWNLTPADQTTLTNFLNGGGRLVITGRDALYEIETSAFVTTTLDLAVNADTFAETFTGAASTAFAGESYAFNSALADEFGLSHDGIAPAASTAKTQGGYDSTPAGWESWPGTSMAAPHVTGAAALVASKYPSLLGQPTATKKILMDTGKPLPATAAKTVTGDMVNAQAALFPRVVATVPAPNAAGVVRGSNVKATFSEAMSASTIRGATFTLKAGTTSVAAVVSYSATSRQATLNPNALLAPNTTYTATVRGGATGVKNAQGDPMFMSKTWRFKTGS
jgi:subtilisin family serine protease